MEEEGLNEREDDFVLSFICHRQSTVARFLRTLPLKRVWISGRLFGVARSQSTDYDSSAAPLPSEELLPL